MNEEKVIPNGIVQSPVFDVKFFPMGSPVHIQGSSKGYGSYYGIDVDGLVKYASPLELTVIYLKEVEKEVEVRELIMPIKAVVNGEVHVKRSDR